MMNRNENTLTAAARAAAGGREGFAMVTALLVVLVLSVLAVGATWLATSEKKTTTAESQHMRSVFSADAGGEAGINFIRTADDAPDYLDWNTKLVQTQGTTAIEGTQTFGYDVNFQRKRIKPGWQGEFLDYDYRIGALGEAGTHGEAGVAVVASRVFREGY